MELVSTRELMEKLWLDCGKTVILKVTFWMPPDKFEGPHHK